MNWTGGRLQRHSTANDSAKQRQKEHFAKVRSGSKFKSPVKWSVFDLIAEDHERSQRDSYLMHHNSTTSNNERSRILNLRQKGLVPDSRISGKLGIGQLNKPSSNRVHQHFSRDHSQKRPTPVPDDDLYNATPPPRNLKRQRGDSVALLEVESFREQEEGEESLSEKRRRILRRGDWVGVGIQKPLQLTFASPRGEENIGRRRKVPHGSHRARYESRQTHITSPFSTKPRRAEVFTPSVWAQQGQQLGVGRADVRISIGGKVVPPGLSSSSAPRTTSRQRSKATPSDVMLLDDEDFHREKGSTLVHRPAQRHGYSSNIIDPKTCHSHNLTQMSPESEQPANERQNYEEEYESWVGISPEHDDELRDQNHNIHRDYPQDEQFENIKETPSPAEQATAILTNRHAAFHPGKVVFSSSSTSIHHPKPQSSRMSVLLRSDSSERAQSTMAEVGMRQPVVASSQVDDNQLWESWIALLYQEQSSQDTGNPCDPVISISPGISTAVPRSLLGTNGSSQSGGSFELEYPEAGDGVGDMSSQQLEPQSSLNSSLQMNEERYRPQLRASVMDADAETYPIHEKFSKTSRNGSAVVENRKGDENEIWRKFVFGSSSDGLGNRASSTMSLRNDVADDQTTYGSSVLAHPATHRSIDSGWSRGRTNTTPARTSNSLTGISSQKPRRNSRTDTYSTGSYSQDLPNSDSSERSSTSKRFPTSVGVCGSSLAAVPMPPEGHLNGHTWKKILFTKPKPFVGRNSMEPSVEEPLHIGRRLLEDYETKGNMNQGRRLEDEIYSTTTSKTRGEIESIDDD